MSINGLGLTDEELKLTIIGLGLKPFVANQVLDWIYKKSVVDIDKMSNIAKSNRETLKQEMSFNPFKSLVAMESESRATKLVATLHDGSKIECVVLNEGSYNTLCVSSQCGCPVDCKFCLTGVMGFKRNLEVGEIVGQIVLANAMGYEISHLVFMGMGEPMLNYEKVFKAIDILTAEYATNISKRKITVSTSGYLHNIKQLIKDKRYINLAFSVGHAVGAKREIIMPIEKRNPISEVAKTLKEYQSLHNRKLTLEYTMLLGINDDDEALSELAKLARFLNAKVNIINMNPHHKLPFEPVSSDTLAHAKNILKRKRVTVTVRVPKGRDIAAACGQLGLVD